MASNIVEFPSNDKMFGLTQEDFLLLAMQDDAFIEAYVLVTDEDIVYNDDSGLPMFDNEWQYEKLANAYFGYRLGKLIDE